MIDMQDVNQYKQRGASLLLASVAQAYLASCSNEMSVSNLLDLAKQAGGGCGSVEVGIAFSP